jgi:hypothetical protein
MKLGALTILAVSSLIATAAAPAIAQPDYGRHGGFDRGGIEDRGGPRSWDLERRMDWLQQRIERGRDDGSLSHREARRVQNQLNDIRDEMRRDRYRNGGHLSPMDRDALDARLDRLNDQIRWARHNDERRPWE